MSDFIWIWGQFIDHDLDLTDAGTHFGIADIEIEDDADPLSPGPITFDRSEFLSGTGLPGVPRQHPNLITAFIDASNVYGSDDLRAMALREFDGGRLLVGEGDLLPLNVLGLPNAGGPFADLFIAGDVRSNENVVLSSIHTLFVREHNRVAYLLALLDPEADDETLYQASRKIVGAELQRITMEEFLPALIGRNAPSARQLRYNSRVNPSIATEFSTAFFRMGHSLLSPNLVLASLDGESSSLALRDAFFNPSYLQSDPGRFDELLGGACLQLCQELDPFVVDDVRNFLFAGPGSFGFDLASLNIQRGRDHGLPDFNTVREAHGLRRWSDFADVSSDFNVQDALYLAYGDIDSIDPWVGGLSEDHVRGCSVGQMLATSMEDQFRRVIAGDRFNWLNDPDLLQEAVKAVLPGDQVTLSSIILANSEIRKMPENVFFTGRVVDADVTARYDAASRRVFIIGNRSNNAIIILPGPIGLLVIGRNGTLVNGSQVAWIRTGRDPDITIDLGHGDDELSLMGVYLGKVLVSLGAGDDYYRAIAAFATHAIEDAGEGNNSVNSVLRLISGRR